MFFNYRFIKHTPSATKCWTMNSWALNIDVQYFAKEVEITEEEVKANS